jgi:predicted esterase YcpF (UPF0227 family)
MIKSIYVISGLGADHRVFKDLCIPNYELIHIKWIAPKLNETISDYATRLSIPFAKENPIILGLSMGGILAIEIAKIISTKQIIILSSVQKRSNLPLFITKVSKFIYLLVVWCKKNGR